MTPEPWIAPGGDSTPREDSRLSENNPPAFLAETIASLRELGGDEFLHDLLATYRRDAVSRMQLLGNAIEQQNEEEIRRVAHAMKGSSLNVGAQRFGELFDEFKPVHGPGALDQARALHERLRVEFERVLSEIDALSK